MKSAIPTLICGLALTHTLSAQSLVNSSTDSGIFGPNANVTNPAPFLVGSGGTATGPLNSHFIATANGSLNVLGVVNTGTRVELNNNTLQFDYTNNSLLGLLSVTTPTSWSATGTFSTLTMTAGQTYRLSFDVTGSAGLLDNTLTVLPSLNVQLLDGGNNVLTSTSSGSLINIGDLLTLGGGQASGTVTVDFVAPVGVNSGPGSVRFTGGATIDAALLNYGGNFATFSNLNISVVPEPSALLLGAFGALGLLRRRRN